MLIKLTAPDRYGPRKTVLLNSDDILSVTEFFEPAFCNGSHITMRNGTHWYVDETPERVLGMATPKGEQDA